MKKCFFAVVLFFLACPAAFPSDEAAAVAINSQASGAVAVTRTTEDEGEAFYNSLIINPEFSYKPAFIEMKYPNNEFLTDLAVTAIESVPFGFILTFIGIYAYEAASQSSLQPYLNTLEYYTPVYAASIAAFAALNMAINACFFYYSEETVK